MKHKLLVISRWLVGTVFVFSGFVKGIDPTGLQYKLDDYLEALHLKVFGFFEFPNAFLLPFAEFVVGVALLTGIMIRYSTKLALAFMIFFTPLTLYIALKNPVTDCGCFGDALVISNWETFYKNIVLITLAILLVINRKELQFISNEKFRKIVFSIFIVVYISIVYWSYNHEPIIDFRPYKIGANIPEGMKIPEGAPTDIYQTTYHYKNLKSNEVKVFSDRDFPWQDTINWKFESMDPPKLIRQGYRAPIHDFSIQNANNEILTDFYLQDTLLTFIVIAYDLQKSNHKKQKELNALADWAKTKGVHFIGLTSTSGAALEKYKLEQFPSYEMMFTDQITLKTIIRSNPGLILLRKGTIIGKWHYNDFPTPPEVEHFTVTEMNKKLNQ
ncbi:MAG: BT_3928 family protein [Mariniphaga sp.]